MRNWQRRKTLIAFWLRILALGQTTLKMLRCCPKRKYVQRVALMARQNVRVRLILSPACSGEIALRAGRLFFLGQHEHFRTSGSQSPEEFTPGATGLAGRWGRDNQKCPSGQGSNILTIGSTFSLAPPNVLTATVDKKFKQPLLGRRGLWKSPAF